MTLLYPRTCVFCGKVHKKGVCEECRETLVYVEEPRCKKCGKPIRYAEQEYCHDCQKTQFSYEEGRSIWVHKEPVKHAIYQFKYHNRRIYAEFFAREWMRLYGHLLKEWGIDLIVPVPLHWRRRWKRGYNQAEVLAKELGWFSDIPVDTRAVVRSRNTAPQKRLDDKERKRNVQQGFAMKKSWKQPRHILLVDDIYTTGSTIEGAARALCGNNDNKVWFFTISIGQDF